MPNRLAREASPYLRQHAHNPVDWHPWGDEALALARSTGRPILLSIGYSSCHWCHVMERESFDDPAIAELMNDGFVNIKVDREERPDVDGVYMRALQSMGGRGGWPLTVFLTPDGSPFYGGTYFPPEARHGLPSFRQVLGGVRRAWDEGPDEVQSHAHRLKEALEKSMLPPGDGEAVDPQIQRLLEDAARDLAQRMDPEYGGMGPAPKFPQPLVLDFLLNWSASGAEGAPGVLPLVSVALERMARGGIRDHLGGGFHRYSVDAVWLVPHFEKMLYDNALLLGTYREAHLVTGNPLFREVCLEIGDYLLTDLLAPEGGLMAARDADSEGEEGLFYVWTPAEIREVLGEEDARVFMRAYGVSENGNFEGRNILHLPDGLGAMESEGPAGSPRDDLDARLSRSRALLLQARARREEPFLDRKVLTGWNGLAIRNLARGGVVFERPDWVEAAARAARYLLDRHVAPGSPGTLARYSLDGEPRGTAFLEDYGAMGLACLALHAATLDPIWFQEAATLAEDIPRHFLDSGSGLLFDTPSDQGDLVVRPRDPTDNAVPSGTSLAVELLLRTGRLMEREDWVEIAERTIAAEAPGMARFPAGFGRMLMNADLAQNPPETLVLAGDSGAPAMTGLLAAAARHAHPRVTILAGEVPGVAESRDKPAVDGGPAGYVCRGFTCLAPVTEPETLAALL